MAGGDAEVDPVLRVRDRTTAWRLAGVVTGIAAGAALSKAPGTWLGLGAAIAGPAFALCVLAGVIAGEMFGRAPRGVTRRAVVEVRTASAFLPRPALIAVVVFGTLLTALVVATSVVASADDQGRWGRAFTVACASPPGLVSTGSPWPGGFYAVPIGLTVLIGLIAAGFAARAVARRHRPGRGEPDRLADDSVRRDSARAIAAAMGVMVTVLLAGSALIAGRVLAGLDCAQPDLSIVGTVLLVLSAVSAVAAVVFVALLLLPSAPGKERTG